MKKEQEYLVFISAYGLNSEKSDEVEGFINDLNEHVRSFGKNELVVVIKDLNARPGNEVIEVTVGQYGIPGRIESGE